MSLCRVQMMDGRCGEGQDGPRASLLKDCTVELGPGASALSLLSKLQTKSPLPKSHAFTAGASDQVS